MARVTALEPSDLQGDASDVYSRILASYGPYHNLLRAFAHRPPALQHIFSYLLQSKADALISPRHLEIALLSASKAHACSYCVAHHTNQSLSTGLAKESIDNLLEPQVPGFDALDHLVRDYAVQVTRDSARVSNAQFAQLRAHFSEEQIVELTLRIALCSFFKRVDEALHIDLETDVALEFAQVTGAAAQTAAE